MIEIILAFLGAWYIVGIIGCLITDIGLALYSTYPWNTDDKKKKLSELCGESCVSAILWPVVVLFGIKK